MAELLERRQLLSAAFDVTGLTALRNDPAYAGVDGSGVGIAVLDSGVYAQNPDLKNNVAAFYNAVTSPVDTPLAANSVASAFDRDGHGSHVSGIAASSNPAIGVAYAAKLVDVHVIPDDGERQLGGDPLTRGLQWVALHAQQFNIKVVNMSLGVSANLNSITSDAKQTAEAQAIDALQALGITVVSAAGNSYAEYVTPGETFPAVVSTISAANVWSDAGRSEDFGAAYGSDGDRYFAVDNSAAPDRLASTSQRSTLTNLVAAPGQDIYSTWNGVGSADNSGDPNHKVISGTSMATPFLAGVVALMQDAAKTFGGRYLTNPNQILQIIRQTADTITDGNVADNRRFDSFTDTTGDLPETGFQYKRVNVQRAIAAVRTLVTTGNGTAGSGTPTDTDSTTDTATALPVLDATRVFNFDGSIGTDGVITVGANDVDLYRLDLESRGDLTIQLTLPNGGNSFNPSLRLFNSAGVEIRRLDGGAGGYPSLNTGQDNPLPTGVYYVGVSSVGDAAYRIADGAGAAGGNSQGDYTLTVSLQNPDPNGVIQGAFPVDLTAPNDITPDRASGRDVPNVKESGILGSDKPLVGSDTRIPVSADVDIFSVTAPDTGVLHVDTESASVYGLDATDTYVKVYDANLTKLGENDDKTTQNTDSAVNVAVTRGATYYVAVTVFDNRGFDPRDPYNSRTPNSTPDDLSDPNSTAGSYDLHLFLDNHDDDGSAATAVAGVVGAPINADIGTDGGQTVGTDGSKDVDWVAYTAPSTGLLDVGISQTGFGFSPQLSLWQFTTGQTDIVKIGDSAGGAPRVIAPVTAGQQVFVAVSGAGNANFNWLGVASGTGGATGTYTLSTTLRPTADAAVLYNDSVRSDTPTPLALSTPINADLGTDGAAVVGSNDVDLYTFTAPSDGSFTFRTNASQEADADTVLRLFDSSGQQIAANDNATTNGKSSRVDAALKGGRTYYVGVSGAGPNALAYDPLTGSGAGDGSTGTYTLIAEPSDGSTPGTTDFGGKTVARYTDAAGGTVTLRLTGPGAGHLTTGATPGDVTLTLDGVTAASTLAIESPGATSLTSVTVDGSLKALKGKSVLLAGAFNVTGMIGALTIAGASAGSTVAVGGIGSLKVAGDFAANLTVTGGIASAKIGGSLTGGTWTVGGNVGSLAAGASAAAWTATVTGDVGTIQLAGAASGTITARNAGTFKVGGNLAGATVRFTGTLRALSVRGTVSTTQLRTDGDLLKATVGGVTDSTIFAGVADAVTALPAAANDFAAARTIGSFTVRSGPFAASYVAAKTIGKITVRNVTPDHAGVPFGFAGSVGAFNNSGVLRWHAGVDPALLTPEGDFVVRLIG